MPKLPAGIAAVARLNPERIEINQPGVARLAAPKRSEGGHELPQVNAGDSSTLKEVESIPHRPCVKFDCGFDATSFRVDEFFDVNPG